MAESVQEQIEYGDHCRHGVAVGTPGGADLMCHYCEMGMNTWVENPRYALYLTFGQEAPEYNDASLEELSWRGEPDKQTVAHIMSTARLWQRTVEKLHAGFPTLHFEVRQTEKGYWSE